jgi:hypothetical protein
MYNTPESDSTTLRIWQQNLNKSRYAQLSLLNCCDCTLWDILALQEPYVNPLNNMTANCHYNVVYPTTCFTNSDKHVRAVTLISASIDRNPWSQLDFPSPDVVIVQLKGPYGRCTIINIYNEGNSNQTLHLLTCFLIDNIHKIKPTDNDHMLWLGDFNHHHPLWEEEHNSHLLTEPYLTTAEPLLLLLAEYGMQQALLKNMPTLQVLATKNWTRPDNVFCSENMCQSFTHCYTELNLRDGTDHIPIISILDLETPKLVVVPKRNFRETDWKKFNEVLTQELTEYPTNTPIITNCEFQKSAGDLTCAIQTTIEVVVPLAK